MLGYPGHIAMFLGTLNGVADMLEAPNTGSTVRVTGVRDGHYATVSRVWTDPS